MQMKLLGELLQDLKKEMLRLGYTESSIKFYQNRWKKLKEFAEERGEIYYSERLGIDFIEKHFQILEKDFEDPYYIDINNRFNQYCINKDYSSVTVNHYVKQAARFIDYTASQRVESCKEITLSLINNYIKTLTGYTYKTVEQVLCSLRSFFKFLFMNGEINKDFSAKIPMVQTRKQTRIPSVWTTKDLKKLIQLFLS